MSGGHWDYAQHKIGYALEEICQDERTIKEFPKFVRHLKKLNLELCLALKMIDWHLSGDTNIKDRAEFQITVIEQLRKCFDGVVSKKNRSSGG